MATRSVAITLTSEGEDNLSYPSMGTVYAEVGDQLSVTVSGDGTTWGEVAGGSGLNAASGSSQTGNQTTPFLSQGIPSSVHSTSSSDQFLSFFSPTGGSATASGKLYINVPNPIISVSANVNSPTATVPVTLTVSTTHSSAGTIMTKSGSEALWNTTYPHVYTYYQARNVAETYYAGLWTAAGLFTQQIWNGVTSQGTAPSGTWGNGAYVAAPGYLAPATSASLSSTAETVVAGASFNLPTISNYDANNVYYLTTVPGSNWTSGLVARTQGSSQLKNSSNLSLTTATSSSAIGTTNYYIFAHRPESTGGTGSAYTITDSGAVRMTVTTTAAAVSVTIVDEGTIEYFYVPSGTGGEDGQIRHYVRLASTQSDQHYRISTSSSSLVGVSSWIAGTGGTIARTPQAGTTDQTALTTLQGSDGNGQSFYVWRNSSASNTGATYTNVTYKRKFLPTSNNPVIPATVSIAYNATSAGINVDAARLNFDYLLKETGTWIVQGTRTDASSDEITLVIGSTNLPSSEGTSKTYNLFHRSPAGVTPSSYISVPDSTVLTRLEEGQTTPPPAGSGVWGFAAYNDDGTLMIDNNRQVVKHIANGQTASAVTAGSNSGSFATGVTLASGDIFIAAPVTQGGYDGTTSYPYWVARDGTTNNIKIYNNLSQDSVFKWAILRKG